MKVLVSACLLGDNCKYNGGNNFSERLSRFLEGHEVISVCPEILGGLPIPRIPAEIVDGVVTNRNGENVDREFRRGADEAGKIADREEPNLVILMSRSPSCGVNQIYDGTFTGNKIQGHGLFADILIKKGFRVIDIEDLDEKNDNI